MTREVRLREEVDGRDARSLFAYIRGGDLVLAGQDLGPSTSTVSDDGEYEWFRTVRAADLPALVAALGGTASEDVLDVLERVAAPDHGYELERLLREEVVPSTVVVV